jgi:hypothetical protein
MTRSLSNTLIVDNMRATLLVLQENTRVDEYLHTSEGSSQAALPAEVECAPQKVAKLVAMRLQSSSLIIILTSTTE